VYTVQQCAAFRVPLIAFGAGSSLEGHVLASEGGVCIDLTRMNRCSRSRPTTDGHRAGRRDTQAARRGDPRQGLFFPVDPGADATIGGMAATRASGTNAVRYEPCATRFSA